MSQEEKDKEWLQVGDCSKYVAKLIDTLNKHESISPLLDSKEKILTKVREAKAKNN